jgi:hypothetical protein
MTKSLRLQPLHYSLWRTAMMVALCAAGIAAGAWWWDESHEAESHFVLPSGGSKAINRAIQKCAKQGGEVQLGAGMYVCTEPIVIRNNHVTLRGAGAATVLWLKDGAECPVIIIGDEAEKPRHQVNHVRVSSLAIDGNREKQKVECWNGECDTGESTVIRSCGIVVRHAVDVIVEDVRITSCCSGGLVTEKGSRRVTVRRMEASDHEFDGLACYETSESLFTDLHLHGNRAAGISTDMRFNGNVISYAFLHQNGTHGIFMRDSHDNALQGMMIRDSGSSGVFLAQVDKVPDTGPSGNSFLGLHVARSGGPAVQIKGASNKQNSFTATQFKENKGEIVEPEGGVAGSEE